MIFTIEHLEVRVENSKMSAFFQSNSMASADISRNNTIAPRTLRPAASFLLRPHTLLLRPHTLLLRPHTRPHTLCGPPLAFCSVPLRFAPSPLRFTPSPYVASTTAPSTQRRRNANAADFVDNAFADFVEKSVVAGFCLRFNRTLLFREVNVRN